MNPTLLWLCLAAVTQDAGPACTPAVMPSVVALQSESKVLTLAEALERGTKNAFAIKRAQSASEKTKAQRAESRAVLGPKGTVGGTYTRFDQKGQSGKLDSTELTAGVSMPLDLSGAIGKSIRATDAAQRASDLGIESEVNLVKNQIRTSYYGVVQADWLVRVQRDAVVSTEQRLEIGRKREQVGKLARFDVLRLETAYTAARRALVEAENQARLARQLLNQVLAQPIETAFDPEDLPLTPDFEPDANQLTESALKNRPDLGQLAALVEVRELIRQVTSKGLSPQVSLSTQYSRQLNPGQFQRSNSWFGVIAVTWPVFDSGITRAKTKQAEEDKKQAMIALDQAKLGVSLEVRSATLKYRNAQAQLILAQKQFEEAKEAFRLANLLFEAGKGILLDVTTAQETLTRADAGLSLARYSLLTAYADLQKAVGLDNLTEIKP